MTLPPSQPPSATGKNKPGNSAQKERLAKALRENLLRRKSADTKAK